MYRFLFAILLGSTLVGCKKKAPDLNAPACAPEAEFGSEEGQLAQNFRLRNQHGEDTYLSDYCGSVVLLQMGAMWCPTCQREAANIPDLQSEYGARDFIVLSLMAETVDGSTPTSRDLEAWAITFDLLTPVLADKEWEVWHRYFSVRATPGAILIDRDGRILVKDGVVTNKKIEDAL